MPAPKALRVIPAPAATTAPAVTEGHSMAETDRANVDSPSEPISANSKEGKNRHYDYHQANQIDDAVHLGLPEVMMQTAQQTH